MATKTSRENPPPDDDPGAERHRRLDLPGGHTARGSLDGLRYGDVLSAPGVVGVRGVGHSYDGFYYVQQVTHTLGRGQYKQDFVLTREGLGTTANRLGSLADAWSSLPSELKSLYL